MKEPERCETSRLAPFCFQARVARACRAHQKFDGDQIAPALTLGLALDARRLARKAKFHPAANSNFHPTPDALIYPTDTAGDKA
ncbi:hypothetical protein [Cupriavidus taiwanensis]|uniref:hypothetical protein n=1 Tax=Cupriavidus taiwanensis TaxID=164546 RepID=UPI0011C018B0|nr:hypothetical protein [Cupriavidus taiwanensis]